ncbi:cobalamin-binding protein [Streptomyces litmocidini]|uniref:cobalamin B12-binding domain-containing protein n=1 Tax=Streptomyces litmocidini TaxID=67318 RepID=UPI00167F1609|nr:cobalamin B12-binding domain-containing protein [Streptomyces litmocidini]GGU97597.1 cobalamin-binding protein [Streptomyces litmocidini]
MTTHTTTSSGLDAARERLWAALGERDEEAAAAAVLDARDAGTPVEEVLLDVIGSVQARLGRAWAAGRISVAQEHAATAIQDRLVAALARRTPPSPRTRPARPGGDGTVPQRVTVACVDGEWHALPARLLAEVLSGRGFLVDYLGAHVPTPHLIAHLHQTGADVVALSSTLPVRLPTAHAAVTAVQAIGIPVIVGGAAFGPDGRYARLLGADGWAPDARAAASLLAGGLRRPEGARTGPGQGLPHLLDQEYTLVTRTRAQLTRDVLEGLEAKVPAMAAYTEEQRERTAEDIAHIVDFLAASLYTDDAELFTGFLTWTAEVLRVRGVPSGALSAALDLLSDVQHDFPRAQTHLAAGRRALAHVPAPQASGLHA